ncbi:carboxypeptidase-like regulatory domain-containing protein [Olleya sp. R77988]|uniref:carboxypeptidase-like regulatory domain-containing protein n=1 Tax=Olleya sp. R77988 TaxID=3093875 RepID=UPI0037C97BFA
MNNNYNLNIKTPCQEDFNSFSPTNAGGFCGSCQQEVVDFSKMNAQEISNYFSINNTQNTCGRFKATQLNTLEVVPEKRKYLSVLSGIGLACFSLLSLTTAQAQDAKKIETTGENPPEIKVATEKEIQVKGVVLDEDGLPLPALNILLEGTTIGTSTDFDGKFEFPQKLKKGDVLVFSYIGYESKKITIDTTDSASTVELKIDMDSHTLYMVGKVDVKQVYKSKKKK